MRRKTRVHEVTYEDWTLDGTSLREVIARVATEQMAPPGDEVTPLSDRWPELAVASLERLLEGQPGDFDDGRIALYLCQIDGDFGCATLSAEVVIGSDSVEWRDLGWQVNYEEGVAGTRPALSMRFERTSYDAVLADALARWRKRMQGGHEA